MSLNDIFCEMECITKSFAAEYAAQDEYALECESERIYLEERGADEVAIDEEMCRVHNIPLYNNLPLCGEAEALRRLESYLEGV